MGPVKLFCWKPLAVNLYSQTAIKRLPTSYGRRCMAE
nr:MAG TPA: hypothetical protein [Caudoviricetes sp.]